MRVEFSNESENDLEQIGDFIAKDNPRRAYSFMRELRSKCEALADMADSFPLVPRYERQGYRRRVHGNYLFSTGHTMIEYELSVSCTGLWITPPYLLRTKPMAEDFNSEEFSDLPPKDKLAFAVPKLPAHSLVLLNRYMRTNMLEHIHSKDSGPTENF